MEPNNMESTTMNLSGNVQQPVQPQQPSSNIQQPSSNIQSQFNQVQNTFNQSIPQTPQNEVSVSGNVQQPVMSTAGYSQPVVNNVPQQPASNETTTLNTSQPQQPVFTQTVAGESQNIQLNTQPVQQVVQPIMQTTVENTQQPVQAATQPQQPKHQVSDKVIIDVKELQYLVSQVKKIAKDEGLSPLTQICYIVVNKEGLRLYASNQDQTIDVLSDTYSYTTEFNISVSAKKFTDLVLNLDPGTVEFTFNTEQKVLILTTETGRFQFVEQADMSTGLTITIDHMFKGAAEQLEDIEFDKYIDSITSSKSIRNIAKTLSETDDKIDGVYCTNNLIISTNQNLILMQAATAALYGKEFALSSESADILTTLTFKDKVKFMLATAQEEDGIVITGAIFTDGNLTFSTKLKDSLNPYIVEACVNYWNQQYTKKVAINTTSTLKTLKRIIPFIEMGTDDDNIQYNLTGQVITVESLQGSGKDTLQVTNNENYNTQFRLPAQSIANLLSTVKEETYTITFNPEDTNTICFNFEDFKCVASLST